MAHVAASNQRWLRVWKGDVPIHWNHWNPQMVTNSNWFWYCEKNQAVQGSCRLNNGHQASLFNWNRSINRIKSSNPDRSSMARLFELLYHILCWTFECHSSFHSKPTQSFGGTSEKRSNPAYGPAPLPATVALVSRSLMSWSSNCLVCAIFKFQRQQTWLQNRPTALLDMLQSIRLQHADNHTQYTTD